MTDCLLVEIPGPVVAKARPRFSTFKTPTGGFFHKTYTPKKTASYEDWIRFCFQEQKPDGFAPYTCALSVEIHVYEPVPASFSQKKREKALACLLFPEKKPDIDNFLKIYLDALNGFAWDDDKRVCYAIITKYYGAAPSASLKIQPLVPATF